jgi:hypothetical protein
VHLKENKGTLKQHFSFGKRLTNASMKCSMETKVYVYHFQCGKEHRNIKSVKKE